jgi:hypothetical protein
VVLRERFFAAFDRPRLLSRRLSDFMTASTAASAAAVAAEDAALTAILFTLAALDLAVPAIAR